MKTTKLILSTVFAVLLLNACVDDDTALDPSGDDATTETFEVKASQTIATRLHTAFADGTTAMRLTYAVYEFDAADESYEYVSSGTDYDVTALPVEVPVRLVAGQRYAVAFWLSAKDAPYNFDVERGTVTVNYDNPLSNDERRDAFYACETVTATADATCSVMLDSPLVQINIGTDDMETARRDDNFYAAYSEVTVKAYDKLNVITGRVTKDAVFAPRTFLMAQRPQGEAFPVDPDRYDYLAKEYVLLNTDTELSEIAMTLTDADGDSMSCRFEQIPLRRNYRTDIYGQLLTSTNTFNVGIDPDFAGDNDSRQ
jgi:hypothetical protein